MLMGHRTIESRHAIDSCTFQLNSWRPFLQLQTAVKTNLADNSDSPKKPYCCCHNNNINTNHGGGGRGFHSKRPCRADRSTSSFSIDAAAVEVSKLSLFDDDRPLFLTAAQSNKRNTLRWKRRRRGSRSVSGRSSDRSGNRRGCCSVGASAAYATCSDFQLAAGTDSSGELFVNGDPNWSSDVSEAAARNSRRERDAGIGERDNSNNGFGQNGNFDNQQGNESGYGSEPGYRGDAEFGYGDEVDEEEDEPRLLLWGQEFGDTDSIMDNTLQKAHHRCRRRKHDLRMIDAMR